VVLFELVYVLKSVRIELLAVSNDDNLVDAEDVKVFKLPVDVSMLDNLILVLEV
jgi:hypothetical protein